MAFLRSMFLVLAFTGSFVGCSSESSRKELKYKELNQEKVIQLLPSVQSTRVDPSQVTQLSSRPRVFLYRGFLSAEECDHLITLALNAEEKPMVAGDDSGNDPKTQISSLTTQLNTEDNVVARIEERISAWTFLPEENSKPLLVSHYGPEEGKQNLDYFGDKSTLGLHQPLVATVILYLSHATRGGEILFPNSEEKSMSFSDCAKTSDILRPAKGNAILFFTLHPSAFPDEKSAHSRCPILEDEMWVATKFFHVNAVDKPKKEVQTESNDGDCTDEDDNCPRWAVAGECQRNSIFMIGSPDYFGTCRKSCNAC